MSHEANKSPSSTQHKPQPTPVSGCCTPAKQESCCAPSEKPQCCGSQQAQAKAGGCGCQ